MENIVIKKEVEVIVTPQAQKVIAMSKFSIEEFIDWALFTQKISFGGHNATVFLEQMYNKGEKRE